MVQEGRGGAASGPNLHQSGGVRQASWRIVRGCQRPDPYWTDGKGRRLPPKPCPKCGANVGPMPLRVEHLRHLGWQPYTVQSYQSWCRHRQEVIPFPREDGSVLFIDVVGGGELGQLAAGCLGGSPAACIISPPHEHCIQT